MHPCVCVCVCVCVCACVHACMLVDEYGRVCVCVWFFLIVGAVKSFFKGLEKGISTTNDVAGIAESINELKK